LSTAAKAGIGVGVAVGVILLSVIAYLLWRLHQSKKAANPPDPGQLSQAEMYAYHSPAEMSADQRWDYKLEQQRIGVLDASRQPAELPTARM
jgi:hypothetical protein